MIKEMYKNLGIDENVYNFTKNNVLKFFEFIANCLFIYCFKCSFML